MADDERQEQFYWLQLLSDLGSSSLTNSEVPDSASFSESINNNSEFFYLDKIDQQFDGPEPTTNHFWIYGKGVSTLPPENENFIDSEHAQNVHEIPQQSTIELNPPESADENQHSESPIDHIWANEYPKALELIKCDLLFHRLQFDLESVNENEDESGFEIVNYSSEPRPSSDLFLVKIPSSRDVPSSYSMLRFSAVNNVVNAFDQLLKSIYVEDFSNLTKKSLTNVLQRALQHLQRVKSHAVVSSFLGTIAESSTFVWDKTQLLGHLYYNSSSHLSLPGNEESKHFQKLQQPIGWDNFSLRYCMSSVPWKERQLIKETREELSSISNMSQFRERINTLLSANPSVLESELVSITNQEGTEPNFHDILCRDVCSTSSNLQQILTKYFMPPAPMETLSCQKCHQPFTLTLFRYHCIYCGNSFCDSHSSCKRKIYRFGIVQPMRVCDDCCGVIDEIHRRDQLMWKDHRVLAFLRGELIHYQNIPSIGMTNTTSRSLTLEDSSQAPISLLIRGKESFYFHYSKKIMHETLALFQKNKISIQSEILKKESIAESTEAIKRIIAWDISCSSTPHEITACIYYKLMIEREFRGCSPDQEYSSHNSKMSLMKKDESSAYDHRAYLSQQQEEKRKVEDLSSAIRYAPLALNIINHESPEDMQRLASLQGLELLFSNVAQEQISFGGNCIPSLYGVFGIENGFPQEVTQAHQADVKNVPSPRYSEKISPKKEVIVAIRSVSSFEIVLTDVNNSPLATFPIDESIISQYLSGEIMIGNDYFELLSREVRDLPQELSLSDRQSQFKRYARRSVILATLQLLLEIGPSLLRLYSANYDITLTGHGYGASIASLAALLLRSVMLSKHGITAVAFAPVPFIDAASSDEMKEFVLTVVLHDDIIPRLTKQSCAKLVREFMLFRSKIFYQPDQSWSNVLKAFFNLNFRFSASISSPETEVTEIENEDGKENNEGLAKVVDTESVSKDPVCEDDSAVYLPGRILHLYFYRGLYQPSYVEKEFESLQKIEFQDHLLQDHKCTSILNALFEIRAQKSSVSVPPKWTAFDEAIACSCCKQHFHWLSGNFQSNIEAHQTDIFRQRFNCRACGGLVCQECCKNYRNIAKYGMIFPRRICDRCLLSGEYALL